MITLRLALTLLLLLRSTTPAARAEDQASSDDAACNSLLTERLVTPPGWGLVPGELEAMGEMFPTLRPQLLSDLRLALFIADDDSLPLFDLIGGYAQTGLARGFVPQLEAFGDSAEITHRGIVIRHLIKHAAEWGLAPVDLDRRQENLIAEVLGPLPFDDPTLIDASYAARFGGDRSYIQVLERGAPSVRALALQSKWAQFTLMNFWPDKYLIDVTSAGLALQRRLAGEPGEETFAQRALLDFVEGVMRGEYPEIKAHGLEREKGAARRRTMRSLEHFYLSNMLTTVMDQTRDVLVKTYATTEHGPLLENSLFQMQAFDQLLRQDLFIDQNLTPFLRRAFAETILKKTVVSGPTLREALTVALRKRFAEVRNVYRQVVKEDRRIESEKRVAERLAKLKPGTATNAPSGPTRAERIHEYEISLKAPAEAPALPKQIDLPAALKSSTRGDGETSAKLWNDLTSTQRSLPDARAELELRLRPNSVYAMPLIRTGFRYRIEFSRDLIEQLLAPRGGEPVDFRDWLEALLRGPARARNQRGWRKLHVPALGRYFWEIKVRSSPYRMLGYQTDEGVWRFELIQLMH